MLPAEEVVTELTRLVWTTVLGLDAEQRHSLGDEGDITTSVDISGAWEGTVSIRFTRQLARHLAAAMMACGDSDPTPDEVKDVIGELTNMVGGNVKGVLPGPCRLSLPRTELDLDGSEAGTNATRTSFECGGQPFSVLVVERANEGRQS
jgi:chemotaxis protein CheX